MRKMMLAVSEVRHFYEASFIFEQLSSRIHKMVTHTHTQNSLERRNSIERNEKIFVLQSVECTIRQRERELTSFQFITGDNL